jgi:hypothetical protein
MCEISDRLDFHDFYAIKPFWIGDFGQKYKPIILIFGGNRYHSDAYALLRVSI